MSVSQISVFLENKPNELNKLAKTLAEQKINIRALSVIETNEFGIVRMIVNDIFEATTVLKENDFIAILNPVLVYEVLDEPGYLHQILQKFSDVNINIEYMYAFAGKRCAYMIFKVSDIKRVETLLRGKGLRSLTQEEIVTV